jgi:hypothetical protein
MQAAPGVGDGVFAEGLTGRDELLVRISGAPDQWGAPEVVTTPSGVIHVLREIR